MRPPLPEGPYLIVGLARSGAAAARMLQAHGEVLGVRQRAARAPPAGIEAHLETDGVELLERVACVVKSPGVPNEAPVIAAARERGLPVLGELELAWRLLPGPLRRGDRHERQDDDHRAARRDLARGRAAGGGGGQRGHAARRRSSGRSGPEVDVVCEVSSFQAEDSERVRARHRAAAQHRGGPPRPPRHVRGLPRGQAARVPQPDAAEQVAVAPAGLELCPARPGGSSSATRPSCRCRPRRSGCAAPHNLENAMGASAAALAAGVPARGGGRGAARPSRACRTGWRRWARSAASST